MLAEPAKIRLAREPLEVAVSQRECLFEGADGAVEFAIERVTAGEIVKPSRVLQSRLQLIAIERVTTGEIVKYERVFWFEPGQSLVHFQAVIELPALGVMVA